MPPTNHNRSSITVLVAFVATTVLAFAFTGLEFGIRFADMMFPDARKYVQQGGSVEIWRLDIYNRLPPTILVIAVIFGAIAGCGFYTVWRRSGTAA